MENTYRKERQRKHRYLVGFVGEGNVFYDMRRHQQIGRAYVEPLTLVQAKRALKELDRESGKHAIYEVVPVAIFVRRKA
jgi:hypothetical protein